MRRQKEMEIEFDNGETDKVMEEFEKVREHEKNQAIIKARAAAFERSPFWFTLWDITHFTIKCLFWLGFWAMVAQCSCDGCVWKP